MDAIARSMYEITMLTGATAPTPSEAILRLVRLTLLNSRWAMVAPAWWTLDLCSPFWRLYVHHDEGAAVHCGRRRIPLPTGRICLVPAWLDFRTSIVGLVRQDFLHFTLTGFPPSLHRRIFTGPIVLPRDALLDGLVERWRAGLDAKAPAVDLPSAYVAAAGGTGGAPDLIDFGWACALAHAAFAAALATLSAAARETCMAWILGTGGVRAALDCIDARLSDPPTNTELAARCGLSVNQFIRRFRAAVGLTPGQYGLERRTAIAAQRLIVSDVRIDDLALEVGFTDRFHFSRAFRARLGASPAEYRRNHHGGGPERSATEVPSGIQRM